MPLCVCSECRQETVVFNGIQQQGREVSRPTRIEHEKRDRESDSSDDSDSDEDGPQMGNLAADPTPDAQEKMEDDKDSVALCALTIDCFNKVPEALATLHPDTLRGYTLQLYCQVFFGSKVPFTDSQDIKAEVRLRFYLVLSNTSPQSFGGSLKPLMLKLAAAHISSPQEVIDRILWTSQNRTTLSAIEERYKSALIRFLGGKGIVHHPLFPESTLTEQERAISPDDPSPDMILVNFIPHLTSTTPQPTTASMDPAQNPDHWLDLGLRALIDKIITNEQFK
ncbi:hypothetical protein B0H10DRAFT_2221233 [Mycena sp. CBHHK59/15]|nr:hypothetical protein B0H10DRAFT_2221233 [Mycena sp. CBHHK59/15]